MVKYIAKSDLTFLVKAKEVIPSSDKFRVSARGMHLVEAMEVIVGDYRKISYIRRTKSQNLNDSRLVSHLSLPNPLEPGVKWRMKM